MANPEHVAILEQGVEKWNQWRKDNPTIHPDLSGADFRDVTLNGINLNGANLEEAKINNAEFRGANLSEANLHRTDLRNADLRWINLRKAGLSNADLSGADLSAAILSEADLTDAVLIGVDFIGTMLDRVDLRGAILEGASLRRAELDKALLLKANFSGADLTETNINKAKIGRTTFGDNDLSSIKGLDTIEHLAPSTIGIDTLYKSGGKIPEVFLRGCGVPEQLIMYMPSLIGQAIQYYSCFISYSSKDQAFAERLYADLQSKSVRCWFAPEDMKIGDKFRIRIDESIRVHEKLLLVLSENSVASDWVEKEVETAMEKERESRKTVLFPVRLDDSVNAIKTGWAADVRRARHIGNFSNWKSHDEYERGFERLLRDLKVEKDSSKSD